MPTRKPTSFFTQPVSIQTIDSLLNSMRQGIARQKEIIAAPEDTTPSPATQELLDSAHSIQQRAAKLTSRV
ncbi:MAG: hypothetical protein M1296_07880 [Chloroflexi bacterium]|nr:hypothetical protein [Chloroflexota bacterium]